MEFRVFPMSINATPVRAIIKPGIIVHHHIPLIAAPAE
jgi:hypothetical protein